LRTQISADANFEDPVTTTQQTVNVLQPPLDDKQTGNRPVSVKRADDNANRSSTEQ